MSAAEVLASLGDEDEVCEPCVHDTGLCWKCAPSVLPTIKQPSWHRDAHRGERDSDVHRDPVAEPLSAEGEKIRERKKRKAETRLLRAINGERTRSTRSSAHTQVAA
jgi:hypothetical protein